MNTDWTKTSLGHFTVCREQNELALISMIQRICSSLKWAPCCWLVYKILTSICPRIQLIWVTHGCTRKASSFWDACLFMYGQAITRCLSFLQRCISIGCSIITMGQRGNSDSGEIGFSYLRASGSLQSSMSQEVATATATCSFWQVSCASGPRAVMKELQLRKWSHSSSLCFL